MKLWRCALPFLIAAMPLAGQSEPSTWEALRTLSGEWTGEGTGQPGEGKGGFSFTPELQNQIWVRRNWADYPAAAGKPASRHDDLMTVYRDQASGKVRALYLDNEGHAILYTVRAEGPKIVFLSDAGAAGPRFRFTYTRLDDRHLGIRFEISPPGQADKFSTYVEAKATKR